MIGAKIGKVTDVFRRNADTDIAVIFPIKSPVNHRKSGLDFKGPGVIRPCDIAFKFGVLRSRRTIQLTLRTYFLTAVIKSLRKMYAKVSSPSKKAHFFSSRVNGLPAFMKSYGY